MTYEKLKLNKAVTYARLLGFEPFGQSLAGRRHFHWYMPEGDDTFSVFALRGDGLISYTVNGDTTSSIERACELLQQIERKQNRGLTDIRAEKTGR
jgi:hypothetical protein